MENPQKTPKTRHLQAGKGHWLKNWHFPRWAEQRATRRWGIFFKSLTFLYLTGLLLLAVYPKLKLGESSGNKEHTAVIDLVGVIAEDKDANAKDIIEGLRDAVKDKNTKGIILHANSPGGSPVQSWDVFDEIRKIKKNTRNCPFTRW